MVRSRTWVGPRFAPRRSCRSSASSTQGQSPWPLRAGLRTQDLIISVDGRPVRNWTDVQQQLGRFAKRTSIVYFRGTEVPGVPQVELLDAGFADLVPETMTDASLRWQTGAPAIRARPRCSSRTSIRAPSVDSAGLRPGDLVVSLDDKPVAHWMDLDQRLQAEPTKTFKLTWKRASVSRRRRTRCPRISRR